MESKLDKEKSKRFRFKSTQALGRRENIKKIEWQVALSGSLRDKKRYPIVQESLGLYPWVLVQQKQGISKGGWPG